MHGLVSGPSPGVMFRVGLMAITQGGATVIRDGSKILGGRGVRGG